MSVIKNCPLYCIKIVLYTLKNAQSSQIPESLKIRYLLSGNTKRSQERREGERERLILKGKKVRRKGKNKKNYNKENQQNAPAV